jgi:hypothetical protein
MVRSLARAAPRSHVEVDTRSWHLSDDSRDASHTGQRIAKQLFTVHPHLHRHSHASSNHPAHSSNHPAHSSNSSTVRLDLEQAPQLLMLLDAANHELQHVADAAGPACHLDMPTAAFNLQETHPGEHSSSFSHGHHDHDHSHSHHDHSHHDHSHSHHNHSDTHRDHSHHSHELQASIVLVPWAGLVKIWKVFTTSQQRQAARAASVDLRATTHRDATELAHELWAVLDSYAYASMHVGSRHEAQQAALSAIVRAGKLASRAARGHLLCRLQSCSREHEHHHHNHHHSGDGWLVDVMLLH